MFKCYILLILPLLLVRELLKEILQIQQRGSATILSKSILQGWQVKGGENGTFESQKGRSSRHRFTLQYCVSSPEISHLYFER